MNACVDAVDEPPDRFPYNAVILAIRASPAAIPDLASILAPVRDAKQTRLWRNTMSRISTGALVAAGTMLAASTVLGVGPASAASGGGNQDCGAGYITLKIDRQPVLGEVISDGTLSVTITQVDYKVDGSGEAYGFSYTSVGASTVYVIVKGGTQSVAYGSARTTDLDTILGPGGRHYGISNVKFCYQAAALA